MEASTISPNAEADGSVYGPWWTVPLSSGAILVSEPYSYSISWISPDHKKVRIVGGCGLSGFSDGYHLDSRVGRPRGLFAGKNGDLFFCDELNHCIRKITETGVITYAGIPKTSGWTEDGTNKANCKFNTPFCGVVSNDGGNMYIADWLNHRIRVINTSTGNTTSIGSGTRTSTDGTASSATFLNPGWIAFNPFNSNQIYVGEATKLRIISATDHSVTTYCGTTKGYKDGPLAQTEWSTIRSGVWASNGDLYLSDTENHAIRRISGGVSVTMSGTGIAGGSIGLVTQTQFDTPGGITWNMNGDLIICDFRNNRIVKLPKLEGRPSVAIAKNFPHMVSIEDKLLKIGIAREFWLNRIQSIIKHPKSSSMNVISLPKDGYSLLDCTGLFTDKQDVYVTDSTSIYRLTFNSQTEESVMTKVHTGGVVFNAARGSCMLGDGSILIADFQNNLVYKWKNGTATKYFGTGVSGVPIIGKNRTESKVTSPAWIVRHPRKPLVYVASLYGNRVYGINTDSNLVQEIIGNGQYAFIDGPSNAASFCGCCWLGFSPKNDYELYVSNELSVRRIDADGNVSTYVGSESGYRDGNRLQALFGGHIYVAFAPNGDMYVSDRQNCVIRLVSDDQVTTIAGSAVEGLLDSTAEFARFRLTRGLTWHPNGKDLIVADSGNNCLRVIKGVLKSDAEDHDDSANMAHSAGNSSSTPAEGYNQYGDANYYSAYYSSPIDANDNGNSTPASSTASSSSAKMDIRSWLSKLAQENDDHSFSSYVSLLEDQGFSSLNALVNASLNDGELKEIGITKLGHRKIILRSLEGNPFQ